MEVLQELFCHTNFKNFRVIYKRPTIIVGDSGGLAEFVKDFIKDENNYSNEEERLNYYADTTRMEKIYNIYFD